MIKRYSFPLWNCYGDPIPDDWRKMDGDEIGDYVKYEDHLAIVEKLKAEIGKAWTQGYIAGLMGED